jgi:hypothetical protein
MNRNRFEKVSMLAKSYLYHVLLENANADAYLKERLNKLGLSCTKLSSSWG